MVGPILTVVGARPNFMKAAPVHRAFIAKGFEHAIIHTGQHYDDAMSKVFFDDLEMPRPAVYLGVGSGTHAAQTANIMVGLEQVFLERRPALVNVVGDVNSTMAGAIVAAKLLIPVAHIEAGLRSRDRTMPEEVNRMVTDAVSDLLLTPSPDADENLRKEGHPSMRIACVGNVMIDTLLMHLPRARAIDLPGSFGLEHGQYAVLTLHRPSNVDDPTTFARILRALLEVAKSIPIVFPVHPRTRRRIEELHLHDDFARAAHIRLVDPLGYLEFMSLASRAKFALTDSGGLQEETTALGIPCLTLRENTERPITVEEGTNTIVGTDEDTILREVRNILEGRGKSGRVPALWDGRASERIVAVVQQFLESTTDPNRTRLGPEN